MKHHLITAIIMALSIVPITSHAQLSSIENDDGKIIYYYVASEEEKTCIIFTDINSLNGNDAYFSEVINIPEYANGYKVTGISANAFHGCYAKKVIIPNTVTHIDDYAFAVSNNLESVTIGNSLESIGDMAFMNCPNLKEITLPNSLTKIGANAFDRCSSLESASLGNSVEYIGSMAFWGCEKLKSINIPDKIKNIGKQTFNGCESLESLIIPNSVTSIGEYAFAYCTNLATVSIPNSVTEIYYNSFEGCDNIKSLEIDMENIGAWFCSKESLQELTLGDNVKVVGEFAFDYCSGLKSIHFGNSITRIEQQAFSYCNMLESVELHEPLTEIGQGAFIECLNLTSVTIPKTVTSIGSYAFAAGTRKPLNITSYITEVFETGEYAFFVDNGDYSNITLYVPYGLSETYRSTEAWNSIPNIVEMEPASVPMQIACNSKGSVTINNKTEFTKSIGTVDIFENCESTFAFTPKPNCRLDQVILNGLDITANVENNTLTCTIPANSQMIVTFTTEQGDLNNDGTLDISDVVTIVNKILGN